MRSYSLALVLAACQPAVPVTTGTPDVPERRPLRGYAAHPMPANGLPANLASALRGREMSPSFESLAPPELAMLPTLAESPLAAYATPISKVSSDTSLGGPLAERLDDLPRDRAAFGLAGLTLAELTDTTVCESPGLMWAFSEGSRDYEAYFRMGTFINFIGDPTPVWVEPTDTCAAALEIGPPDDALVSACTEAEGHDFFPEGSDCRSCLEAGSGYAACVVADQCAAEALQSTWVMEGEEKVWYREAQAFMFACAPEYSLYTLLLADVDDDGTLPLPFDHAGWKYICLPSWDDVNDRLGFACISGDGGPDAGDALGEGVSGYVDYIREIGETTEPWHGRSFFTPQIRYQGGATTRWQWMWNPSNAGAVSSAIAGPDTNGNGVSDLGDENFGFPYVGWGLNPYHLRPGGTDPSDPDDTLARDWIAATTLKGSTTANGIYVSAYNHNRCARWDPLPDGSFRCGDVTVPDAGWLNDGPNVSTDSAYSAYYPILTATIGTTGLPDVDVPGELVIDIHGSAAMANPHWDACDWPHRLETDRMPYSRVPDRYDGLSSFEGDTYRFGKPGDDIVMVLNTNFARGFCPAGEEGVDWKTHENADPDRIWW